MASYYCGLFLDDSAEASVGEDDARGKDAGCFSDDGEAAAAADADVGCWDGAAIFAAPEAAAPNAPAAAEWMEPPARLPHLRRADLPKMGRGDAAAATWIFRGARVAATPRPRRGYSLRYATSTPGVGGAVGERGRYERYQVTELLGKIPQYEGSATPHWVIRLKRQGGTTAWCRRKLAKAFELESVEDVGCCGSRDEVDALVTQHFSIPLGLLDASGPALDEEGARSRVPPVFKVSCIKRAGAALRPGMCAGTAYAVVVSGAAEGALETCKQTLVHVLRAGARGRCGQDAFFFVRSAERACS